jgi:hypothetical protein
MNARVKVAHAICRAIHLFGPRHYPLLYARSRSLADKTIFGKAVRRLTRIRRAEDFTVLSSGNSIAVGSDFASVSRIAFLRSRFAWNSRQVHRPRTSV